MNNKSVYIPFARKYRPANFAELMGQEVLVKTLSYCIENNRLAQAYLLTGIRGVGKTSSARIIAKTVNCTDLQIIDGKTLPCEKCKNCESFNKHSHPDIIELDAASRTSIDDIREIIESCEYRPLIGKNKFFIIDEIHMLSKSAFNALLKIVEEPPAHVVFIFATTEVQKIPLTVISRCQRYDLKRFSFEEIFTLIKKISVSENISVEEDALKIIASKSEGSARDAVALLDQAASYLHNYSRLVAKPASGSKKSDQMDSAVTANIINDMLGLIEIKTILRFIQLIIGNSPAKAIELLHQIYYNSSSLEYFVQEMAGFIAELSKYKVINDYHSPLYSEYSKEITDILIGTSLSKITTLWQIFNQGENEIKQSHNELTCVEMLIIKAIYACNLPNIEDIIDPEIAIIDPIRSVELPASEKVILQDNSKLYEFLKFCYQNREIDIYYLLMNEVQIDDFSDGTIAIKGNVALKLIAKIEGLLEKWSGIAYKVTHSKSNEITSLKKLLLDKVRQSEDYNSIKNYFPNADISDIILQN